MARTRSGSRRKKPKVSRFSVELDGMTIAELDAVKAWIRAPSTIHALRWAIRHAAKTCKAWERGATIVFQEGDQEQKLEDPGSPVV